LTKAIGAAATAAPFLLNQTDAGEERLWAS